MNGPQQDEWLFRDKTDAEGAFDAQLSLPLPSLAPPAPFQTVLKRDGRHEPFQKRKIAEAIFRAAQSVGGQDRDLADSLASAVAIYLMKRLQGQAPTVDHVHDAVERVLIQMSHARTALAYARYRDRRARIRRLRQGDMRQLLGELEEARIEREAQRGEPDTVLAVRTSGDTVAQWDRARIVAALERETGLDAALAEIVAIEVEQQIHRAGIRTLTTSLVRELVDARLIEHGLEDHRERHRRLGVPLFDAERIIRGTVEETLAQDPVATDEALAAAVKKEYALAQVFQPAVAEAHLRGDFHLHHLERVDRLFSAAHSLQSIVRFGMGLPGTRHFAAPPKHAPTLLAQWAKCNALLQGYFAEMPVWDAVNVLLAPFAAGMSAGELKQFAQMIVYEFAYQTLRHGHARPAAEIGIAWNLPDALAQTEAIGPGGQPTGKPYSAYAHTVQQLAWLLIETIREGGVNGVTLPAPLAAVQIDPGFFQSDGHDSFLTHTAAAVSEGRLVAFALDRDADAAEISWRPRRTVLQQITLNLPRIAYESTTEAKFHERAAALIALAFKAHIEKRNFIEGLMDDTGARPLALLATKQGGEAPVVLDEAWTLIAVDGLNEAVQALCGNRQMHEKAEAAALATRLLERLAEEATAQGFRVGLRAGLAPNNDPAVSRRFATLDARAFPKTAATTVKADAGSQALSYTAGARLNPQHGLSPFDALRIESPLHAPLAANAVSEVSVPMAGPAPDTMAGFIEKAYYQTGCKRLVFG